MPSGSVGSAAAHRHLGLDVVVAPQRLHGALQPQAHLGLVELGAPGPLALLLQPPLGLGAAAAGIVEPLGDRPHLVALAPAGLLQLAVASFDGHAVALDQLGDAVDRGDAALDGDAPLVRLGTGCGVGGQPSLGLGQATLEVLLALVQPGVVHLQLATARRQPVGLGVERGAGGVSGAGCRGLGLLVGLQCRQELGQLGDARPFATEAAVELGRLLLHRGQFGVDVAPVALRVGQRVRRGAEAGVVGVQPAGEPLLGPAGLGQLGVRGSELGGPAVQLGLGVARAAAGLRRAPRQWRRLPPRRAASRSARSGRRPR